eukprot:GHVU01215443.1.p1 GENE.GHVU01215443.1~~GHVU01215443.1.p1  ORF type:complete len:488 (-),score=76.51 GHVU01215443.1:837-2300(-)
MDERIINISHLTTEQLLEQVFDGSDATPGASSTAAAGAAANPSAAAATSVNLLTKPAEPKPRKARPVTTVALDCSQLSWSDITVEVTEGPDATRVLRICGHDAKSTLTANSIRQACTRLGVSAGREPKKDTMIDNIMSMHDNRVKAKARIQLVSDRAALSSSDGMDESPSDLALFDNNSLDDGVSPLRPNRSFVDHMRLWNLASRDDNAQRLIELSVPPSVSELQRGGKSRKRLFWEDLAAQFGVEDDAISSIQFPDDIILARITLPVVSVPSYPWDKLQGMYKDGVSAYRLALSQHTRSGTHQKHFFGACNGQLIPYYISKVLETKPGLDKVVAAHLSSGVKGDSTENVSPPVSRGSTDKRKQAGPAVSDIIAAASPPELAAEKVLYLKAQREWTEKRSRLEDLGSADRERDGKARARGISYTQWTEASEAVRKCRTQLETERVQANREDLQQQLELHLAFRDTLAAELGFQKPAAGTKDAMKQTV